MSFLDSSVIVEYLDGSEDVVEYVEAQPTLRTSSICVYEVLVGEVFGSGETDVPGTRAAFGRVTSLDVTEEIAIEAASLQERLLADGEPLAARDLLIAATCRTTDDELVVADAGFEIDHLADVMAVTSLAR